MKKVLIFGATGFVGRYLVAEFVNNGYEVLGTGKMLDYNSNFIYKQCDITNSAQVYKLIEDYKPSFIINLAGISSVAYSWENPNETIDINLKGAINILEAIKQIGIETKILLVGSSEEYKSYDKKISEDCELYANNPYGISKVAQEQFSDIYRKKFGLSIYNVRTFNHTGVGQKNNFAIPSFINQIKNCNSGDEILVGNLNLKRDIGHVKDMVCAYRMILECGSNITTFNVGSGELYLLEDLLKYIIGLSKKSVKIIVDKKRIRPIDNNIIWCDNSLLKKEIGWRTQYTVYDAIDEMYKGE